MELKFGDNKSETVAGATVSGLNIVFNLQHNTANTAFTGAVLNLLNATLEVNLNRMGGQYTLVNDPLLPLVADSAFQNWAWKYAKATGWEILTAAAVGVKEIIQVSLAVDFGGVLNLVEADTLVTRLYLPAAVAAATVDTSASSCTVNYTYGSGIEAYTPYIKCKALDAASVTYKDALQDPVLRISFINVDKTLITTAQQVITTFTAAHNQGNPQMTYNDLLSARAAMLADESTSRAQSFVVLPFTGQLLKNVKYGLTLNGANVAASSCFLVHRYVYSDSRLLQVAASRAKSYANSLR